MTEKEKCAAGMLYDASEAEREREHLRCADLCFKYNHTLPSDTAARKMIIREIFGRVGDNFYIEPNIFCGFGYNIEVGENFFTNNNCVFVDPGKIIFGDNVMLGPGCGFYTAGHPLDPELRRTGVEFAQPIYVGNDVWVGGGTIVLPGVKIGNGTVIGAGSVVTRDIPDGVVAFGNPCRVHRELAKK